VGTSGPAPLACSWPAFGGVSRCVCGCLWMASARSARILFLAQLSGDGDRISVVRRLTGTCCYTFTAAAAQAIQLDAFVLQLPYVLLACCNTHYAGNPPDRVR
jgi:hypothetical protein